LGACYTSGKNRAIFGYFWLLKIKEGYFWLFLAIFDSVWGSENFMATFDY
jgi:hypothetical protein